MSKTLMPNSVILLWQNSWASRSRERKIGSGGKLSMRLLLFGGGRRPSWCWRVTVWRQAWVRWAGVLVVVVLGVSLVIVVGGRIGVGGMVGAVLEVSSAITAGGKKGLVSLEIARQVCWAGGEVLG